MLRHSNSVIIKYLDRDIVFTLILRETMEMDWRHVNLLNGCE